MRHDPLPPAPLRDIAWLFFKLGTTAFGGPAAHMAMMEDEVVRRRGWLRREDFLDYVGATNLIPGPNSTELAMHIGQARAGRAGLVVAGASFIIPAALIAAGVAWTYVRMGALPEAAGVLWGIKPVVIAVIVQALWRLGRTAVKTSALGLLGAASMAAALSGTHELIVLAVAAAAAAGAGRLARRAASVATAAAVASCGTAVAAVAAAAPATVSLWSLFLIFGKAGAVLFGSGYVLFAFLRADLVDRLHWLSEAQLIDAIAVGQVTPGPLFTTATFIGYLLGGATGAAVATAGIFLPAFVYVAISGSLVGRIRQSPTAATMLDGVNVASLGLMAAVLWHLAGTAFDDAGAIVIALVSFAALTALRINSAWLILAGGLLGWVAAPTR